MKKVIKVKKLIKLVENSLKVGDVESEIKLRKRLVDLSRSAKMCLDGADEAEERGNIELAQALRDRVSEIESMLNNYNIDTIDTEEDDPLANNENEEESEEPKESEEDSEGDSGEESDDNDEDNNEEPEENDINSQENSEDNPDTKDNSNNSEEQEDDSGDTENSEETEDQDDEKENSEESDDPLESNEQEQSEESDEQEETEESDNQEPEKDNSKSNKKSEEESEEENDEDEESEEEINSEEEDESDEEDDSSKNKNKKSSDEGEEESNDEDDEYEEEETDDSPVEDPFADEEDIPNGINGLGSQDSREANLDDIIRRLKDLSSEGKRGAIDALNDLIKKHNETTETETNESLDRKLTEAKIKNVREMTDDEFGDFMNATYDLLDKVKPLPYVDDVEARKAKVGEWSKDPLTAQELQAEDNLEIQKDYQKKKAREKEKAKYNNIGTLDQFKINFYKAINNQVEILRQEIQSYAEINPEYESEDVIMKADIIRELPDEAIPVVDIYFDVSGSWEQRHIDVGKKAIASVKAFEDAGELKINVFYFSNGVDTTFEGTRTKYGTGTAGWRDILKNIKATGAKNVLVMTDGDIKRIEENPYWKDYGAEGGPVVKVDGCVWFLWKDGDASPSCPRHLIGRQGNYQYAFHA